MARHTKYHVSVGWWLYLAAVLLMWMQWRYGDMARVYGRRFDWQAKNRVEQMTNQFLSEWQTMMQKEYPALPPEFPERPTRWWHPKD